MRNDAAEGRAAMDAVKNLLLAFLCQTAEGFVDVDATIVLDLLEKTLQGPSQMRCIGGEEVGEVL